MQRLYLAIICGKLPNYINSVIVNSSNNDSVLAEPNALYNTTFTYKCKDGYWFKRGMHYQTITCGDINGQWKPTYSYNCTGMY